MSLKLELDSSQGLSVQNMVQRDDSVLFFFISKPGELSTKFTIGPRDMAELVKYWMTNTDLTEDDPRVALLEMLANKMDVGEGNPGRRRFRVEG